MKVRELKFLHESIWAGKNEFMKGWKYKEERKKTLMYESAIEIKKKLMHEGLKV